MARKHCWSLSSCLLDSANRRGRSGTEIRTNVWNKACSSIPTCSVSSGLNALLQSCLQEVPCIALIRSFRTLIPDIHSWLPLLKLYANRSFKGLAQADPPPLSADGLSLDTNSAWERRHSAEIDSKTSVEWKACKERLGRFKNHLARMQNHPRPPAVAHSTLTLRSAGRLPRSVSSGNSSRQCYADVSVWMRVSVEGVTPSRCFH